MSENRQASARADLKLAAPRSIYFAIFAISGFSGLIYESIWSHYLKLFLGHAAYAQSLVLMLFMGGMAIGSWIASRYSSRARTPIIVYAAVELIIGLAALVFHGVFTGVIEGFYATVLPSIGVPAIGATLKWLTASILILPQSILLGMTFPLMSAGIIRRFPDTPGGSIAMLYFTNSIGAAIGVLASGFWFIDKFGLPGTIMTAGLINIMLAMVVWMLVRLDPQPETEPLPVTDGSNSRQLIAKLFMFAAFITGAASFIYEISWIRMLSLVLGATTHSFELMLSAFITGLAFGGLWIKRRIDRIDDPVRFSGWVQIIMGGLALLTIPVYMESFGWMEWLLHALQRSEQAYAGYTVSSHVIALLVMLPTTFMAGMTLPLFTYVLLDRGAGEASIGRIYAANTVGAIVGVLFAVHIGLPLLGVKNLIVFGAMLDIVLGIGLVWYALPEQRRGFATAAAGVFAVAAIAAVLTVVDVDERVLSSGVYRSGDSRIAADDKILFYKDGKTATVSMRQTRDGNFVLLTNGKPDAAIQVDLNKPASLDEVTMTLLGSIAFGFNPDAKRVANIGMGSGQTTHVVLGNANVEKIDTIEIEAEMANASRRLGPVVARAHEDPRSVVHIEDAKTFFSLHHDLYDIIIAEPSNPWVSGVASLFSTEFYSTVRRYLEKDGLFVQWIQLYEFSDDLLLSILKALHENFADYAIYVSDSTNILLVATSEGNLGEPDWSLLWEGELKASLERVSVFNENDIKARRIIDRKTLQPYLEIARAQVNSDYYPFVDLKAGEARFREAHASDLVDWQTAPIPLLEMLNQASIDFAAVTFNPNLHVSHSKLMAYRAFDRLMNIDIAEDAEFLSPRDEIVRMLTEWVTLSETECSSDVDFERWHGVIYDLSQSTLPFLSANDAEAYVDRLFNPVCDVQQGALARAWYALYRSVASRDAPGMATLGSRLLEQNDELAVNQRSYLIGVSMLGHIAAGETAKAHEIWKTQAEGFFDLDDLPGHIKLLAGIAVGSAHEEKLLAKR